MIKKASALYLYQLIEKVSIKRPKIDIDVVTDTKKVAYWFSISIDRYYFDFDKNLISLGWKEYSTPNDSYYFGVWINLETY